jgi:hypothetical protein
MQAFIWRELRKTTKISVRKVIITKMPHEHNMLRYFIFELLHTDYEDTAYYNHTKAYKNYDFVLYQSDICYI